LLHRWSNRIAPAKCVRIGIAARAIIIMASVIMRQATFKFFKFQNRDLVDLSPGSKLEHTCSHKRLEFLPPLKAGLRIGLLQ